MRASHVLKLIAVIYRKNSTCGRREREVSSFQSRCPGGVQLDITAAASSKPKVLQTASSISWLTLFLHPPQPTTRAIFFFLLLLLPFSTPHLPLSFKNFSTRHPRNFQITSPFPSSFLKIHPLPLSFFLSLSALIPISLASFSRPPPKNCAMHRG